MGALIVDVETTIFAKGNPFAERNKLCYVGAYREGGSILVGTDALLPYIRSEIISAPLLVGFNFKFDIHWLYRCGIDCSNCRIWDCQLAHFLLTGQRNPYPSLEGVCEYYGIPGKLKYIEENYWSEGIDTPDIPQEEMLEYLTQDLWCTMQVYLKQVEDFKQKPQLYRLFQLDCKDILVLVEMERNGLLLNVKGAKEQENKTLEQIRLITNQLDSYYPGVPINWDSGDHVSRFLYGGTISVDIRVPNGTFKSGLRIGQPRYRIETKEYPLPRLVEPIQGSELKKEGLWSTDQSVIGQIKHPAVKLLLERARLTKLLDYFVGLPALLTKKDWKDGILHGNLNKTVARTGRLSASDPNQQNLADEAKQLIESRYA